MSKKKLLIIIAIAVALALCAVLLVSKWIGQDSKNETQKTEAEDMNYMAIETPHGQLYYPQQWENQVRFDVTETVVTCYGLLEGHDAVALFDIYFGKEEGYPIGVIGDLSVNIKSYSLELDESWEPEQKQILYAMQEDVNYLIAKLQELDNFVLGQ